MTVIRGDIRNQVESDREFQIARVEIHEMVGSMRGNVVQQVFGQITVRVYEPDAVSQDDMLQDQIAQKGGFSRPRFSDHVYVLALVDLGNAKKLRFTPAVAFADCD